MQKYEAIQKLSSIEFRRLTGVRKETFVQIEQGQGQGQGQGIVVMQDVYFNEKLLKHGLRRLIV